MDDPERQATLAEYRVGGSGEHELVRVRLLDRAELVELRSAANLISEVGASREFRRLQELTQLTLHRVELAEARDSPSEQEVQGCLAGVDALVEAQVRFTGAVVTLLRDAGQDSASTVEEVRRQIDALDGIVAWTLLRGLAEKRNVLVRNRRGVVGVLDEASVFRSLSGAVTEGFMASQNAFTITLAVRAPDVLAAGRRLRLLHAECPEGLPTVVMMPRVGDDDIAEELTITPETLPVELVGEALRMARLAQLIAAEDKDGGRGERESREEGEDGADAVLPLDDDATTQPGRERAETGVDTGSEREAQEVVDLPGLLGLASTLNDALEEAWSGALVRAAAEEGIAEQMAAVRGAVKGFQRQTEREQVAVGAFPPGGDEIAELESDLGRAVELAVVAQLKAFINVLDASKQLAEPTRVRFGFSQEGPETLSRFWESGAFAQLRGRLDLLRNLLTQEEMPPDRELVAEASRRLQLARTAWFGGDPEACLFHSACALAAVLSTPVAELDDRLPDHDQRTAVIGVRTLLASLQGRPSLALATLTAPALADTVADLTMPVGAQRPMTGNELFDWIAQDIPYESLSDD